MAQRSSYSTMRTAGSKRSSRDGCRSNSSPPDTLGAPSSLVVGHTLTRNIAASAGRGDTGSCSPLRVPMVHPLPATRQTCYIDTIEWMSVSAAFHRLYLLSPTGADVGVPCQQPGGRYGKHHHQAPSPTSPSGFGWPTHMRARNFMCPTGVARRPFWRLRGRAARPTGSPASALIVGFAARLEHHGRNSR
jgi:hypothetical protein